MQLIDVLASGVVGADGGSVTVKKRGTSTDALVYTDYKGTSVLAQPIVLDSNGGATLYVNEEVDVSVLNYQGAQVRAFTQMVSANVVEYIGQSFRGVDYDNASTGVNKPITVQAILDKWITSSGMPDWNVSVGGVETTLENAIASFTGIFINVKSPQYGAVGDASTDDTAAIQNALNAAGTSKAIVFFPPGSYKITATLTVPVDVHLWASAAVLLLDHATDDLLEYGVGSTTGSYQEIRGLAIASLGSTSGTYISVTVAGARRLRMVNCLVSDLSGHQGTQISFNGASACYLDIESCLFALVDPPILNPCISADNANSRVLLSNSVFVAAGAMGATGLLVAARKGKAIGCTFDMSLVTSGTYIGILMSSTAQWTVTGCEFIAGSGTSTAMTTGSSAADTFVHTAGNIGLYGFTTPFSGFTAGALNPQFQITERDGAIYRITDNAASVAVNAHLYGETWLKRSAAGGAQDLTSGIGPVGATWTIFIENASGGALGGAITFGTGFYSGTPPPTLPTNTNYSIYHFRVAVDPLGGRAWVPVAPFLGDI